MKKGIQKTLLLICVSILILSALSTTALAATNITLKKQKISYVTAKVDKKCKVVSKGTYIVTAGGKKNGYVKFTAPAGKKYTFKVSAIKPQKISPSYGLYYFFTTAGESGENLTAITEDPLYVTSSKELAKKKPIFRTSRTAKYTLEKDRSVYLYFYFEMPVKFKLTIK